MILLLPQLTAEKPAKWRYCSKEGISAVDSEYSDKLARHPSIKKESDTGGKSSA